MFKVEDLANYEGREHAKAKHALLESYIQRYTMILGVSQVPRLAFVDAFAGPWRSGADDLSDTSFSLSLQALTLCAETLRARHHKQPKIRALWIEEDPEAFDKLSQVAAQSSNSRITVEAEHGRFQDKIEQIVRFIGSEAHAFVFVDPKGYKQLIEPDMLAPLLSLPRAELLINYMWRHISFALARSNEPGHVQNMRNLYGSHADRLMSITDGAERENASLVAYESELRRACTQTGGSRLRVLSYPIRDTHGQQYAKYYLVHTTHADRGLVTFAEECEKAERTQGLIFQIAQQARRDKQAGTNDMFAGQVQSEPQVASPATAPWLNALRSAGDEMRVNVTQWAALLEEGRCLPSALQAGARLLMQEGVLRNVDASRSRPKNVVNYEKGELVRRIK
jgi:three-Cys-motif partner protein